MVKEKNNNRYWYQLPLKNTNPLLKSHILHGILEELSIPSVKKFTFVSQCFLNKFDYRIPLSKHLFTYVRLELYRIQLANF